MEAQLGSDVLAKTFSTYVNKLPEPGDLKALLKGFSPGNEAYIDNMFTVFVDGSGSRNDDNIEIEPLDSFRMRIYVAPYGLWLTLDAGEFEEIDINSVTKVVRVGFASETEYTPAARLRIEQPAQIDGVSSFRPDGNLSTERRAFIVPLESQRTWIELTQAD